MSARSLLSCSMQKECGWQPNRSSAPAPDADKHQCMMLLRTHRTDVAAQRTQLCMQRPLTAVHAEAPPASTLQTCPAIRDKHRQPTARNSFLESSSHTPKAPLTNRQQTRALRLGPVRLLATWSSWLHVGGAKCMRLTAPCPVAMLVTRPLHRHVTRRQDRMKRG